MGGNCLYLSNDDATQPNAVTACQIMGAELATLKPGDRGWTTWNMWSKQQITTTPDLGIWIGLNDIENVGSWVWQDGSSSADYVNWWYDGQQPDGDGDCVMVHFNDPPRSEYWSDISCDRQYRYACSMRPAEECSSEELKAMLQKRICIKPMLNASIHDQALNLPAIDIFLNPAREEAQENLIKEKKDIARNYSNVGRLFCTPAPPKFTKKLAVDSF